MILEFLEFASVIFAPPVRPIVKFCPWEVGPETTPGKSDDNTLPFKTWYCKTLVNWAAVGVNGIAANSASKSANALFVGANTVNGPVPDKIPTKSGCPSLVNAPTNLVKFGLA